MTPADLARQNAISFECKKDSLRQTQAGTWKIAFTVQGLDMDERLTKAFPGTRYQAVLVEINDDELPVHQPDSAKRDKRNWPDVPPTEQAGIRCDDPIFQAFLREQYPDDWEACEYDAAEVVRFICGVNSRCFLGVNHAARMIWKQLDDKFQAWKAKENA